MNYPKKAPLPSQVVVRELRGVLCGRKFKIPRIAHPRRHRKLYPGPRPHPRRSPQHPPDYQEDDATPDSPLVVVLTPLYRLVVVLLIIVLDKHSRTQQ